MTLEVTDGFTPRANALARTSGQGTALQRSVIAAGVDRLESAVRSAVPGGSSRMRRAVGSSVRHSPGESTARITINRGRQKGRAPHALWYINGTKLRATKNGANRGRMPADDFFSRGIRRGKAECLAAMRVAASRVLND